MNDAYRAVTIARELAKAKCLVDQVSDSAWNLLPDEGKRCCLCGRTEKSLLEEFALSGATPMCQSCRAKHVHA